MKAKVTREKTLPSKKSTVYPANIARMEQYLEQTRSEYVTRAKRAETEPGGPLAGPTARPRTAR